MSAIETHLKSFFTPNELWVLALSGGPDSMALFLALKKIGQPFVIAHVDHGWRDESAREAELLAKWAGEIPFFLKRFQKEDFTGNLEQDARQKRLRFFREILAHTKAKGVVLAHHADDAAETVFKKLMEGVPLFSLGAMKPVSETEGLILARPLLNFTKKELVAYVGSRPFFVDETNVSDIFLRGRMRKTLLPFLTQTFGKNVEPPLAEIARDSQELAEYLEEALKEFKTEMGPKGPFVDLSSLASPFLLKARIHRFLSERGLPRFRAEIGELARALREKREHFTKIIGSKKVVAHKGVLYLLAPLT